MTARRPARLASMPKNRQQHLPPPCVLACAVATPPPSPPPTTAKSSSACPPARPTPPCAASIRCASSSRRGPTTRGLRLEIARRYFDLAMAQGDPRYVGYASAAIAPLAQSAAGDAALLAGPRPDPAVQPRLRRRIAKPGEGRRARSRSRPSRSPGARPSTWCRRAIARRCPSARGWFRWRIRCTRRAARPMCWPARASWRRPMNRSARSWRPPGAVAPELALWAQHAAGRDGDTAAALRRGRGAFQGGAAPGRDRPVPAGRLCRFPAAAKTPGRSA